MRPHRWMFPLAMALALAAGRADAHFLFARVLPPAEGGRAVEVYFSELAEAGDPRFIDKIADTRLWLERTPGSFEPLTTHQARDRLRAWVSASGSMAVVGECVYGVLGRRGQKPFLLRHFPKALAGNPGDLNRLKPYGKLPLEVVASFEGDRVRLVALRDGKPVPHAALVTVDAALANTRLTADGDGRAVWTPPAPGTYAVYTRDTRAEAGSLGGKPYEEVRDFATVAFDWPLERRDADPAAVALFEEALAARAWWRDFPGFTADVRGNLDGRTFGGTVTVNARGEVAYTDDDPAHGPAVAGWVEGQLESIVLHRLDRPAGRSRPVLRFAAARDEHPLGRLLIFEGGKFASSYRVKDRQLTVVNRIGARENLTITVLESSKNPEGAYLPRSHVARYWDARTGRLLRTETVQDTWRRVGSWDLPAERTVTTATDAGLSVRGFTLANHRLLRGK